MGLTEYHVAWIKRQHKPNTSPPHLIIKAEIKQLMVTHMTSGRTRTTEQGIPGRSTGREDAPQHATTAIYSDATNLVMRGLKAADGLHQSYVAMRPGKEMPHTLSTSQMRYWITNSLRDSSPSISNHTMAQPLP